MKKVGTRIRKTKPVKKGNLKLFTKATSIKEETNRNIITRNKVRALRDKNKQTNTQTKRSKKGNCKKGINTKKEQTAEKKKEKNKIYSMRKAYKRHIKTHTQNKTKAKREISDTTYKECTNYKRTICQTVRYLSMKRFHHDLITLAGTL